MSADPQTILLVEDSRDDAFFLRYELKKTGIKASVQVVEDGQEAIHYLTGTGKYADRMEFPFPTVILLDLKLPLLSGFDVLARMREEPALSRVPVLVLTGSSEARDRARALELGARGYFVKPWPAQKLREAMESLSPAAAPAR
jgi:CheY-like chemotaxis protein